MSRGRRDALLAFYYLPPEHWRHLRTTNPIESTFTTVRLRTAKAKGTGSRIVCLTMVFKLALSAQVEPTWRGCHALPQKERRLAPFPCREPRSRRVTTQSYV